MTAKTKLTQGLRGHIAKHMLQEWEAKQVKPEDSKERKQFMDSLNKDRKAKFPQKDVEILIKYKSVKTTTWQSYVTEEGRIFRTELITQEELAPIPYNFDGALPISAETEKLFDAYTKLKNNYREAYDKAARKYREFLMAFKYIEDAEEYITIPEYIRPQTTALVAISEEMLAEIKKEFKKEV